MSSYITNGAVCANIMGFGAVFQGLLEMWLQSQSNPSNQDKFVFTPFHGLIAAAHHGLTQEAWDHVCNEYMTTVLLPRDQVTFIDTIPSGSNVRIIIPGKTFLDHVVAFDPGRLDKLKTHFEEATKEEKLYFDPTVINVAIHVRAFSDQDTETTSGQAARQVYRPGNEADLYYRAVIANITRILDPAKVCFHLYSQFTNFQSYEDMFTSDRVGIVTHSGNDLFGDLLHMIKADLFVASKSSLSNVVNYYRHGLTIARPFWHTFADVIYHGLDGVFTRDQESLILTRALTRSRPDKRICP